MLTSGLLLLAGFAALFLGADWLVKGSVRIARTFGVPSLVIGLTLVAFGTSLPEFLVTVTAAFRGSAEMALGNVIGSNIANVGLILGTVGLLAPIFIDSRVLRREIPQMLAISLVTYAFAWDGQISRVEGVLLVSGVIAFTLYSYYAARRATRLHTEDAAVAEIEAFVEAESAPAEPIRLPLEVLRTVAGMGLLVLGAQWLVDAAATIARSLGVSDLVIGLTLVALGTSLPELATSLVSALRKEDDISVGNIVGSNVFNLLAVLGGSAAIRAVNVDPVARLVDFPVMLAFSLALVPIFWDGKLARWQGGLLLVAYVVYTGYLFLR